VGFSEGGVGEKVAVSSGGVGVDVISGVDVDVSLPGVPLAVGLGTGVAEGVELDSGEGEGVVVGESPGSVVGVEVSPAAEAVEVSIAVGEGVKVGAAVEPGPGEGVAEASSSAGAPVGVELEASPVRETSPGAAAA
jgi:hypothetical protein